VPAGLAFREGKEGTDFADKNPYLPHIINPLNSRGYNYRFKLSLD